MRSSYKFLKNVVNQGSIFISIEDAKHYNFSDVALYSPLTKMMQITGGIDGKRGLEIIGSYTLAFFDEHLKGKQENLIKRLSRGAV